MATSKKKSAAKPKIIAASVRKPQRINKSGFLVFVLLFAVVGTYLLVRSFAASPNSGKTGGKTGSTAPLSLSATQISNNPNSPAWCDNEDDVHDYLGSGSLSGSLSATQQFCGLTSDFYNGVYWDAGGEGTGLEAYSAGAALTDMTITSPGGDVHHAVLVGTATSKGVTTYHYQTCYVPAYSQATDTGGTPLAGGTWTYTISGTASKVSYYVRTQMTDVKFQQAHCPLSEQNLTS